MEVERQGIVVGGLRLKKEKWRMVGVYVGIEEMMQELGKWVEKEGERRNTIVGGDFNFRMGEEGARCY